MANLLPLETFRAIFGIHPLHFWGLSGPDAPVTSKCNTVVREYAWQEAQAAGRQEIRQAIETAEARLREHLGYSVAPRFASQVVPWPGGYFPSVQLAEGYVQAIGAETLTQLGEAAVTYSDTDGDGLKDTFVATIATTETDPERLAVYLAAADRLDGAPLSERWRVAPVSITISGGTATVRGRRWLLVRPILYEGLGSGELNPATDALFATHVAIATRTAAGSQATLTWESRPYPWFCCASASDGSGDPAAIATATGRVGIHDALYGIVHPAEAVYNADSATWHAVAWSTCRPPDRVTITYLAGVPLVNGQMDPAWQVIVARLAAAELAKPICACETANRALHTWTFDVARTGGANDESYGAVSQEDLQNPFGTRRGHIYAWKQVKRLRQLRGFLPG